MPVEAKVTRSATEEVIGARSTHAIEGMTSFLACLGSCLLSLKVSWRVAIRSLKRDVFLFLGFGLRCVGSYKKGFDYFVNCLHSPFHEDMQDAGDSDSGSPFTVVRVYGMQGPYAGFTVVRKSVSFPQ